MGDSSPHSGMLMGEVAKTNDGYVCHKGQPQDANLCFSHTGSTSVCRRCHVTRLDGDAVLRVSTDGNPRHGSREDERTALSSSVVSASVAQATVVPYTLGSACRFSSCTTTLATTSEATQIQHLSSGTSDVSSSRVAIVKRCHRARGFSDHIAERMSRAQKPSSIQVYEGKWRKFHSWCQERSIDPLDASVDQVATFLCHLHEQLHLAVSTIEGYRTAISHTIKAARGMDLGKDPDISSLMSNLARENVKKSSTIPPWDLSLVLRMLTKGPFEPLHRADLKHLTLKTVFLVALATGKRRSELHAMRSDILHSEGWGSITILPDPSFVAKTQLNNCGAEVLNTVTIKALTKILGADMQEDRSLCAVRALRYYLKNTKDLRKQRKKLFIAYKKGFREDQEKIT